MGRMIPITIIPYHANRVAKFNVATQNVTFIGDEYEDIKMLDSK